jgi:hypothetical protein
METLGPAGESLRLAEHYRRLTDDELIALAHCKGDLTEIAQQALAMEISTRRLTVPPPEPPLEMRPTPPPDSTDEEDTYSEERQLVGVATVWSQADAWRLQAVLDTAGIPFFMGKEKATSVDKVTSNFADGVPVEIMQIGVPWASEAMKNYSPQDEPPEPKYEDADDLAIHCPKCHSTEVVFEDVVDQPPEASGNSSQKYHWTCDSCGYEWQDDGVERR